MTTESQVDVSVIMPAFNAEKYVAEAVSSIFDQTFANFELIVVNDGSTDRTLAILSSVAGDGLRVLSNAGNMGVVKSANKGIAESRSRYIARQDADDISLPEQLQKQFEHMEKHPEIALLGTGRKTTSSTGVFKKQKTILVRPTFKDLLKGNCFAHGSVMIRKKALEAVGNYNEMFRLSENYELWLRIAKQFPVANLPEVLYILRRHPESVSWKYTHNTGFIQNSWQKNWHRTKSTTQCFHKSGKKALNPVINIYQEKTKSSTTKNWQRVINIHRGTPRLCGSIYR